MSQPAGPRLSYKSEVLCSLPVPANSVQLIWLLSSHSVPHLVHPILANSWEPLRKCSNIEEVCGNYEDGIPHVSYGIISPDCSASSLANMLRIATQVIIDKTVSILCLHGSPDV